MLDKAAIEKYFVQEKQAGLVFLVIGLAAALLAIIWYASGKSTAFRGAALPLLAFGFLQAVIGYSAWSGSDSRRVANVYAFDMNPAELKAKELPRMQSADRSIRIFLGGEIAAAAVGLGLFFWSRGNESRAYWHGFAVSLFVMAAIWLVSDVMASDRAQRYLEGLAAFARGQGQ